MCQEIQDDLVDFRQCRRSSSFGRDERMARILDDHQLCWNIHLHQTVIHQLQLFMWNEISMVAMNHQKWRIVCCHMCDRGQMFVRHGSQTEDLH